MAADIPHCLLTFLHVAGRDASGGLKAFVPASYDFGDGTLRSDVQFGLALLKHLGETGKPVDRLILLGTPGSSWGRIVAHIIPAPDPVAVSALDEACARDAVSDDMLAPWSGDVAAALSLKLGGRPLDVVLGITGYAGDADGQREFIELIGRHVPQGAALTVDPTHSLRHLPLLGVFSAMTLQRLKGVELRGIYYGARDRTGRDADGREKTPVWRLDGLPRLAQWLSALSAFDKDGDYGVFQDLLCDAGVPAKDAANLAEAAFNETIGNFDEARARLDSFRKAIAGVELKGPAAVFKQRLMESIDWTGEVDLYLRQRRLALAALKRGDVLRAATWGHEAFVTRLALRQQVDPLPYRSREDARKDYLADAVADDERRTFERLQILRNQIAHAGFQQSPGTPYYAEMLELVRKRDKCLAALGGYLASLLPERVPEGER